MLFQGLSLALLAQFAFAARPFLNEPDTGIADVLNGLQPGELPNITAVVGLPDFDYVARNYMNVSGYTYYRNGAAGEWSYRNNLEAYGRVRFRPRVLVDITKIEQSLPTTLLGHNVSAPFFISPCAKAGYAHEDGEINFLNAAADANILYVVSDFTSKTKAEIQAAKKAGQVLFQQTYVQEDLESVRTQLQTAEKAGFAGIVLTVDSAADGNRHRAARYGVGSADASYTYFTWDYYQQLRNMTRLPIIPKGIMSVEDAQKAVELGAPAIYLSNHGGRQLDGSPSPLEVALEIHEQAPDVFTKTEVYADGGVRYGADAIKLLALGVKAVGIGRPIMYSNVFGEEGVSKAIKLFKHELAIDAGNLGVPDLKQIDTRYVSYKFDNWYS
ncbi:fmn-dependent dehydrogenase [Diplodia corticola]|uniref:Fmn-dependent dehydrogenase n=1 Tax=Diplodia corticola TaxID=236234 RepID=A0A1J9RA56_9PEZI|nr:fmn-dependent dehydrogenase [Diplodia corticola]OJD37424.1 fmn-dependent dehydrogenase [Diplodia corticola]